MNYEKVKILLERFLLINFILLALSGTFYGGMLYEYKEACPKGENVSILFGGKINLDTSLKINESFLNDTINKPINGEDGIFR